MGDLSKWESKSVKGMFIAPLAGIGLMIVLIIVMAMIKSPPLDIPKKTSQEAVLEVEDENEVDWNNF